MEAPKEIFLTNSDLAEDWDWVDTDGISWCETQINDTDIAYIRKDLYNKLKEKNRKLRFNKYHNQQDDLTRLIATQARIKELEKGLREITGLSFTKHSLPAAVVIARKLLEKESEG